jgi:hypothetical protein
MTTATVTNGLLSFSATDDGAGAGQTFYSLDSAPFQVYTAPIPLSGGTHTLSFYSTDAQGNQEPTQTQTITMSVSAPTTITGSVPATLALTLGAPASFGAFTPGITHDYTASTTANVLSTAGNATLSVSDPDTAHPGHLVNGTFWLPSAVQAAASSPGAGAGSPPAAVGGAPVALLNWAAPVSNDLVTIAFAQHIGSGDALRTGSYGKTLTFTLSTTTP